MISSSDIFYSFAAVFIIFRLYFIFKKESDEVIEINPADVRTTLKKVIDPYLFLGLLNLTWQIAGLFSSQKLYFILLLIATFLPALFMFQQQPSHRREGHFIFISIIKIMIAAHIFVMHFFF